MYFGRNVPPQLRTQLSSILGMPSGSDPRDYLGLPAIWGRSKRQSLAYVKGKVLGKIQGWKQSSLSLAVCKDLDSLAARFWWGDADGKGGFIG